MVPTRRCRHKSGADVSTDIYAYTAWYNDFSAFIPPWAHDGGTAKLVERLKDPATREKIRKDMLTASGLGISCHSLSQSFNSEHVFANLFARGRVFEAFDEFRGSSVVSPRRNRARRNRLCPGMCRR